MILTTLRLMLDTATLVIIWSTQLVIYPSFLYYPKENLNRWHKKYVTKVSYIIVPSMTGQLIVYGYQLSNSINSYTLISSCILAILWLSTFLQFVPIHNRIAVREYNKETIKNLIAKNWIRTLLWSALFGMSASQLI